MKPLTIQQVKQAVNGIWLTAIPEHTPLIKSVCTDTRRIDPGCLFIALKGENFDAHDFLAAAAQGGALAALVERSPVQPIPNLLMIQVKDARKAMGRLAQFVRKQMRAKVIAVAGSNGKTTTKYLIDAAISRKLRGTISPKSFNNDIGVPLAIFPADPVQDYLVLEIGTNHPGEIKVLADMALPDIAVITNCGAEHLEFLRDINGVRKENAEIIGGLNKKGTLIVNGDDPELLFAVRDWAGQRFTFGFEKSNDLFAADVQCDATGVHFKLNNSRRTVFVPMLGKHNACNALAAIAVAKRLGVPEEMVFESLAEARGPEMRLQPQQIGNISLINDAYNANPDSMRAALETVAELPSKRRKIAVLGDMLELGETSDQHHREAGEHVAKLGFDQVVCVGKQATLMGRAAEAAGLPKERIYYYPDSAEAANEIPKWLRDDDLILLKGSRSTHLEYVVEGIRKKSMPDEPNHDARAAS